MPRLTPVVPPSMFNAMEISRLPEFAGDKTSKKPFKRCPIGYFHIDMLGSALTAAMTLIIFPLQSSRTSTEN